MYDLFDPAAEYFPPLAVAETGTNNSFATASVLGEGVHTFNDDGQSWFQFDAQAGPLEVTMTPRDGELQTLNMELRNSSNQVIATGFTPSGAETISYTLRAEDTYYLWVYSAQFGATPPSDLTLSYTIDLDVPQVVAADNNNTRATAASLGEGRHEILGREVDWFRIDAPEGYLSLTMTAQELLEDAADARDNPRDLNMELYNSAGQLIRTQFSSTNTEELTQLITEAGTYYVRIYTAQFGDNAPDGTVLSYALDVDFPDRLAADGNDTQATAQTLTEGTHRITGTGQDWFRFDSTTGTVGVTLNNLGTIPGSNGTLLDLNVELRNANGEVLATDFNGSARESFQHILGEAGTYYLRVYWAAHPDGVDNVALNYSLELDLPEADAREDNDQRDTAPTLGSGSYTMSGTGVDWYRIDSLSGLMNFSMTPIAANGEPARNLNMELYNANGQSIRANFSDGATDSETFNFLAGEDGTYYLKVYWAPYPDGAPNGIQLNYTLNVTLPTAVPSDGNDSRATATVLGTGTQAVTAGTGVDWYRINTGPGMMDFTMRHTGATGPDGQVMDLNMELYNANGEVVRGEFVDFNNESFSFLSPATGTYYLKVYWAPFENGAPNGYTLNYEVEVDLPINTWSRELDFGPVRNASIALYDIDNDGRDEIFIGTSKGLDENGNEVRPAGLIVLEDDGTIKWTHTFAAFDGPDPHTGLTYNTSSVSTQPVFSDVNNDGRIDIIVGVGADNRNEFGGSGQPGDLGRLYALDADGNELWHHDTIDSFGSPEDGPDGRPDGVYGAPLIFDLDADGIREVIFTSWDHYLYVLDGRDGSLEKQVDLHDTAGATPAVADLNNDGLYELVVPADITDNPAAGLPNQGGILHVFSNYGQANIPGWTNQVGTSTEADFRGQFEGQSLWSSPRIVDLDRDGVVEIVQGTGNFFQEDGIGEYVKVWNADGTLRYTLNTDGRVLASPLIADLDGDGGMEIVAATISGHVHAWSAGGTELFNVSPQPFMGDPSNEQELPIVRQPTAVDLDNDGDLEILLSIGSQAIILDSDGTQLTSTTLSERAFGTYAGSPAVRDIDGDGRIDILTGGTTEAHDQAIIYRWENITDTIGGNNRIAAYQDSQSLHDIQSFVERFYSTILNRTADAAGRNDWTDELATGVLSGADVARGFINSREFQNRGTSDEDYVNILYAAFFGRVADSGGFDGWMGQLSAGTSRADVLDGFIGSREFANLANSYGIRPSTAFGAYSDAATIVGNADDTNVLRGGAGDNVLYDEGTGVAESGFDEAAISGQVYRLYGATLGRTPDSGGFISWFNGLTKEQADGGITLQQAAGAFVGSREFSNTYGALSNNDFVELLYQNVLNRAADAGGLASWVGQLDNGTSRADIVLGFSESREFQNRTNSALDSFMRSTEPKWMDVLEGGAGNDVMNGGTGSDTFVFRAGQGGSDTIHGFEPWDVLQLSGFGFDNGAQARAHMTQQGANVVFAHGGQTITFLDTTMSDMARVRYNVS